MWKTKTYIIIGSLFNEFIEYFESLYKDLSMIIVDGKGNEFDDSHIMSFIEYFYVVLDVL